MKSIISLINVTKKYPTMTSPLFKNLTLSIEKGSYMIFSGPSGSGKSTLLNLIGGFDSPTHGKIIVDDHDISSMNEDELARFRRGRIGIIWQFFYLLPTLNALQNVMIALEFAGWKYSAAKKRASEVLKQLHMEDRMHALPSELSGGEMQRVAIARAIAPRPKILLADEPTGNLDEENALEIAHILYDLNKSHNLTICLATHNLELFNKYGTIITLKRLKEKSSKVASEK